MPEHGTASAYRRHLRRGDTPCAPCRAAHSRAHQDWRARRQAGETTPRPLAEHGTLGAYRRHLRHDEEPCEPCRTAHRVAERDRYQRRRGRVA